MKNQMLSGLVSILFFGFATAAWADCTFEGGVLTVDGETDLKGESLAFEGITSVAGIGSFVNSGAVADLSLEINKAVVWTNATIGGNIRLVKTGSATLTIPKESSYNGGTWVKSGKLVASSGSVKQLSNFTPFGAYETVITVEADGTLDLKGYYNWQKHYSIVLNGGTLTNGAQTDSTSTVFDPNLTLTANSSFKLTDGKAYSFAANADLGGNVLTMSLGGKLHWLPSAVGNGTVEVTGSSTFQVDKTATYSGLTLDMGAPMDLQSYTLGVKDYVATYTGTGNKGTGALQVSGVFTPTSDNFYPCTMMDGSTIDLSSKETTWSLSNAAGAAAQFAAGATVTIDVGAREIASGDKIVSWVDGTEYAGREFVLKTNGATSEDFELQVSATGLTVAARGAKVPTATWTGAVSADATNPDNWSWVNVPEPTPGLTPGGSLNLTPGPTTAVVIPWEKLATISWPDTANLSFATIEFAGEKPTETVVLDGDRDWRGLGPMDIPFALDLNGHKLYLVLPGAASANETTVTSSVEGGELYATVATDKVHDNTSVALTGNLTLIKEGPGAFVATKHPQTYTGETVVNEGTLRAADSANVNKDSTASVTNSPFGGSRVITVGPEGVLDPRGSSAWGYHTVNLNGGAISNTLERTGLSSDQYGASMSNQFNPDINLMQTSVFATEKTFNYQGKIYSNGNKLRIWIANGQTLVWNPNDKASADIEVVSGGYLRTFSHGPVKTPNCSLMMSGGTLHIGGVFEVSNYWASSSVSSYKYDARQASDESVAYLKVYGTFRPETDFFFACTIQDGATIDLSGKTSAWSTKTDATASQVTSSYKGTKTDIDFADGATVTIDVGEREFKGVEQIVAWSEGSKTSAAGATFVLNAAAKAKGYCLTRDANGLFVGRKGFVLIFQ